MKAKEKNEANVKAAYALALETGGIAKAQKNIEQLMKRGAGETFGKYFPRKDAFSDFRNQFGTARFDVIEACGWQDEAGSEVLQTDPLHGQEIPDYFERVFQPAVLGKPLAGGEE